MPRIGNMYITLDYFNQYPDRWISLSELETSVPELTRKQLAGACSNLIEKGLIIRRKNTMGVYRLKNEIMVFQENEAEPPSDNVLSLVRNSETPPDPVGDIGLVQSLTLSSITVMVLEHKENDEFLVKYRDSYYSMIRIF